MIPLSLSLARGFPPVKLFVFVQTFCFCLHQALLYLDKKIGMFLDVLESEGWLENSILVVVSDNGGCPGQGGSNYPLRGAKAAYFEGGTKV